MKKNFLYLMILIIGLTFSACGGGGSETTSGGTTPVISLSADAGVDKSYVANKQITLNATRSTGAISSYHWTIDTQPQTSSISLSNVNSSQPTFTPSVAGTYIFSVEVDSNGTTASDSVNITVTSIPVALSANAGSDNTTQENQSIGLDASTSTGSGLTYRWTVQAPTGAAIKILNLNTAKPTFSTPNVAGTYTFTVHITDSTGATDSDSVDITVTPATPIVLSANAGNDKNVGSTATITLDGNASTGSSLSYSWSVINQPSGAAGYLSNSTTVSPVFHPNIAGEYTIRLTVTDSSNVTATDTVVITGLDTPIAIIRLKRDTSQTNAIIVGDTVNLSASLSVGNELTYLWEVIGYPGTAPAIVNATSVKSSFIPSESGTYNIRLTVTDSVNQRRVTTFSFSVEEIYLRAGSSYPYLHIGDTLQLNVSGTRIAPNTRILWNTISTPSNTDNTTVNGLIGDQASLSTSLVPLSVGRYDIRLYAIASSTKVHTVSATVLANPVADAGANISIAVNQQGTLNNAVNGSTGTSLSYSWTSSSPNVILNQADTVTPTFSASRSGTYTVTLTVTDHSNAPSKTATDTVNVRVFTPISK